MSTKSAKRSALVTGGSRGIGRAISQRLALDGYVVFINYCSDTGAAEATADSIAAAGGEASIVQADVRDGEQVKSLFRSINAAVGRLDVLVNNVGRVHEGLVTLTSVECFLDVLKTNLLSAYLCSQAAVRMMLSQKQGCIVNVSSTAAFRVPIGLGAYAIAKAGINALTKGLAREVGGRGIRVNAIAPAYVETEMLRATRHGMSAEAINQIPLQRIAQPNEIAAAVAAIVRDDFSYLLGQVIVLDGGRSA